MGKWSAESDPGVPNFNRKSFRPTRGPTKSGDAASDGAAGIDRPFSGARVGRFERRPAIPVRYPRRMHYRKPRDLDEDSLHLIFQSLPMSEHAPELRGRLAGYEAKARRRLYEWYMSQLWAVQRCTRFQVDTYQQLGQLHKSRRKALREWRDMLSTDPSLRDLDARSGVQVEEILLLHENHLRKISQIAPTPAQLEKLAREHEARNGAAAENLRLPTIPEGHPQLGVSHSVHSQIQSGGAPTPLPNGPNFVTSQDTPVVPPSASETPDRAFTSGPKSMSTLYLQRVPTFDAAPDSQTLSAAASASDVRTTPTLSLFSLLESGVRNGNESGSGRDSAAEGQHQQSVAPAAVSTRGRHRKLALFPPRLLIGSGSGTPRRPESGADSAMLSSGIVTGARHEPSPVSVNESDLKNSGVKTKDLKGTEASIISEPNAQSNTEMKAQLDAPSQSKQEQMLTGSNRPKKTAEQLAKDKHLKKDAELRKILNKIRGHKDDRSEGYNAKNQFDKILHKVEQAPLKAYELVDIKSKAKLSTYRKADGTMAERVGGESRTLNMYDSFGLQEAPKAPSSFRSDELRGHPSRKWEYRRDKLLQREREHTQLLSDQLSDRCSQLSTMLGVRKDRLTTPTVDLPKPNASTKSV